MPRWARQHGAHILAPSLPVASGGMFHNRAWLFAPNGKIDFQEKRQMTRFEKEQWGIAGGRELKIFDLGEAKIGVAICYDIEFPLIAHAMVQAGADLILAPSCTDTLAGANRGACRRAGAGAGKSGLCRAGANGRRRRLVARGWM